jgi:hypothetical protein
VVANFATLISTHYKGFTVIMEPYPKNNKIFDPML